MQKANPGNEAYQQSSLLRSHSAKNIFESPNSRRYNESTQAPFTPHLRSHSRERSADRSPIAYRSPSGFGGSNVFSNDLLRSIDYSAQNQPRSTVGRTSPFNSQHLATSQRKYSNVSGFDQTLQSSPMAMNKLSSSQQTTKNPLKESSSYANAMKALQTKIKTLENDLVEAKREKEKQSDEFQRELNTVKTKNNEEKGSLEQRESRLKTRIELMEHEINEKARLLGDAFRDSERLKEQLLNSETDCKKEYQAALVERNQFRARISELEYKFEHDQRRITEAALEEEHWASERNDLRDQVQRMQEKCIKLEKEVREKDINYEWKVNELSEKNAHLDKIVKDSRAELEREFTESSNREKELKQRNEELMKEKFEMMGQIRDLRAYARDRDNEVQIKADMLVRKEHQVAALQEQLDGVSKEHEKARILSDVTQNYANDVADVNDRLLTTLIESTRHKSTENKQFGFPEQPHWEGAAPHGHHHYGGADPMHVADLDPKSLQSSQRFAPTASSTGRFNTPGLKSNHLGSAEAPGVGRRTVYSAHSKQTFNPHESTRAQDYAINTNRHDDSISRADRFSFSNTKRAAYDQPPANSTRRVDTHLSYTETQDTRRASDEAEYENIIKKIVAIEKELLELSRQYQNNQEDKSRQREALSNLGEQIQSKNENLISLKKREEEIMNRFFS